MRKIVLLLLLLSGCSSVPSIPGLETYKIDIQQGNYVTQAMASKLKPGMTRAQVRFALGTPLVVDLFRTDRWDYVYMYQKRGVITEYRKLAVFFEGDKLLRVEGDVKPEIGSATLDGSPAPPGKPDPSTSATPPKPVEAAAPAEAKPEGATLTTTTGEPVSTMSPKTDPVKPETSQAKPQEEKPQEEKGFFGGLLDKIGF